MSASFFPRAAGVIFPSVVRSGGYRAHLATLTDDDFQPVRYTVNTRRASLSEPSSRRRVSPAIVSQIVEHTVLIPKQFADQAVFHAVNRMDAFWQMAFHIAQSMEQYKKLREDPVTVGKLGFNFSSMPPLPIISSSGARYQGVSGSRSAGTAAAHAAPCQLLINDVPLDELFPPESSLGEFIRFTFGRGYPLPEIINHVDSLTERRSARKKGRVIIATEMGQRICSMLSNDNPIEVVLPPQLERAQDELVQNDQEVVNQLKMDYVRIYDVNRRKELDDKIMVAEIGLGSFKSDQLMPPDIHLQTLIRCTQDEEQ